ncbi:MAG: hypothetical protein C0467_00310 [Planctomycetaceae bacterium]|nr:hypothetical protein [Planctomycetaceae bacterium]
MSVRVSRATSVIVHQVPVQAADRFLALQGSLTQAVEVFPGYQATEVYPPSDPNGTEWVVVIHFADAKSLKDWIDSPTRAKWTERLGREIGEFRQETLATGFGAWFTRPSVDPPPGWKMVATVLLGLYPTVMLLTLTVGAVTAPLGMAVAMLIGNALSVVILQYAVMPALTRVLGPWLHANARTERTRSFGGIGVIVLLLAGLALVFRQIAG